MSERAKKWRAMVRTLLVRHGQSIWNAEGRVQGHQDPLLSEVGKEQAHALAERLRGISIHAAYSSDLSRCVETAHTIVQAHKLMVVRDADLRERGYGVCEGRTVAEMQKDAQTWVRLKDDPQWTIPGGESARQVYDRMRAAMRRIVQRHEGETVLVVTHGGPLRFYFLHVLGLPLESYWQVSVANASLSVVEWHGTRGILTLWNDTCHLNTLPRYNEIY